MSQARILVVEDDHGLREAIVDTLLLAGYACQEADSAEAALLQLGRQSVDMVISDIQMGGMDGHTLLTNIRLKYPNIPVLLMTAYANIDGAVRAMREGAIDYLAKPFNPRELLARIKAVLRRSHNDTHESAESEAPANYYFAQWKLDSSRRELVDNQGVSISLSTAEYDLLRVFLKTEREQVVVILPRIDAHVFRLLEFFPGDEVVHLFESRAHFGRSGRRVATVFARGACVRPLARQMI